MSEREFWMQVYIAAVRVGNLYPGRTADEALNDYRRGWNAVRPD